MFLQEISNQIGQQTDEKAKAIAPETNHAAVVLFIQIDQAGILLGADLEEHGHPDRGWQSILSSTNRPQIKSSFFKVAHHGSPNGDHPNIWSDLLEPQPLSVLTPWNKGQKLLQHSDVARLRENTNNCFATARIKLPARKRYGREIEKTFQDTGRVPKPVEPAMGAVRLRNSGSDINAHWKIEFFGSATQIENVFS